MEQAIQFSSIMDFAERGPIEGSFWPLSVGTTAYEMRVISRHHDTDSTTPFLIEVGMTAYSLDHQVRFLSDEKLWIIVRLTDEVVKKFHFQFDQSTKNIPYAIIPDFFVRMGLTMNTLSPINDVSIGFSRMTGLDTMLMIDGMVAKNIQISIE